MRTQQEINAILQKVQAKLDARQLKTGIALRIFPDGYVEDDDWLNVIVSSSSNGKSIRAHQYVDTLSEVEKELQSEGISDVLLVPALSD